MAKKWYYGVDGKKIGPVEATVLRNAAASGEITNDTPVRREDMDKWTKAKSIKGLIPQDEPRSTPSNETVEQPTPPPSSEKEGIGKPVRWWNSFVAIFLSAVVFLPVSVVLVWLRPNWKILQRVAMTFAVFVLSVLPDAVEEARRAAKEQEARQSARQQPPQPRSSGNGNGVQTADTSGHANPIDESPGPKLLHNRYTRVENADVPLERTVSISKDEFREIIKSQPNDFLSVPDLADIDFSCGPKGEPIRRAYFGYDDEWSDRQRGVTYFYEEAETGDRILHGTTTYVWESGYPDAELLSVQGRTKAMSEWTEDGRALVREIATGDEESKKYEYRYFRGGEVAQLTPYAARRSPTNGGKSGIAIYKHGTQTVLKPSGEYLNQTNFIDGKQVGVIAWSDGKIDLVRGDTVAYGEDVLAITEFRHPKWEPIRKPNRVGDASEPTNVLTAAFISGRKGIELKYRQEMFNTFSGAREDLLVTETHRFAGDGESKISVVTQTGRFTSPPIERSAEVSLSTRDGRRLLTYHGVTILEDAQVGETWTFADTDEMAKLVSISGTAPARRAEIEVSHASAANVSNSTSAGVRSVIELEEGIGVVSKEDYFLMASGRRLANRYTLVSRSE